MAPPLRRLWLPEGLLPQLPGVQSGSSRTDYASGKRVAGMAEKTILIVDDEAVIRDMLSRWLEFTGHRTCTASNGREGLERMDEESPDLVITDVLMPEMDGHEFCRRIRETSDIPIIMLSGLSNTEEVNRKVQELNLNISAFLSKPLHMEEFLELVDTILRQESTGEPAA